MPRKIPEHEQRPDPVKIEIVNVQILNDEFRNDKAALDTSLSELASNASDWSGYYPGKDSKLDLRMKPEDFKGE